MAYTQGNNPFKKLLSDIGSGLGKLNIKSPDRSSPTSQQAYQQAQLKRPAHQKESKFQYDIRMRREAKKGAKSKGIESSITSGQENRGLQFVPKEEKKSRFSTDQGYEWNPLTKKFESTFDISKVGLNVPEMKFNPGDLTRQSKLNDLELSNFGITDEMSMGEAFQQAKLVGMEPGASFEWRGKPIKYEYEGEEGAEGPPEGTEIIEGKHGPVSQLPIIDDPTAPVYPPGFPEYKEPKKTKETKVETKVETVEDIEAKIALLKSKKDKTTTAMARGKIITEINKLQAILRRKK